MKYLLVLFLIWHIETVADTGWGSEAKSSTQNCQERLNQIESLKGTSIKSVTPVVCGYQNNEKYYVIIWTEGHRIKKEAEL